MNRWHTIASDPLAAQVCDAVRSISRDLLDATYDGCGLEARYPFSLGFGRAGVALFLTYHAYSGLHDQKSSAKLIARAKVLLVASIQALQDEKMPADLFRGVAGIVWVYEHVRQSVFPEERDQRSEEIHDFLGKWCASPHSPAELTEGCAGICLYASELAGAQDKRSLLDALILSLSDKAQRYDTGIAWVISGGPRAAIFRHRPNRAQKDDIPIQRLGVAHGVAGIAGALTCVYGCGFQQPVIRDLVLGATRWILAQRANEADGPVFPQYVGVDMPLHESGWCDGDLGISMMLYNVANVFKVESWKAVALDLARSEAHRKRQHIGAEIGSNYTVCHGLAGRAHIFNRLFQQTGEEVFRHAALYWLREILTLRTTGEGVGGFLVDEPSNGGPKNVKGFLMGAAGLGLTMLAAITEKEPCWDRLILASTDSEKKAAR